MSISIQEADLESSLADLREVPLAEIDGSALTGTGRILSLDDISAFNSSI